MNPVLTWLTDHQYFLVWSGAISLFVFIASLLSLPWLVAQIPDDYFLPDKRQPAEWKEQHPLVRLLALVGKNLIGLGLILAGI